MIQLRRFTAPLITLFLIVLCHLLIGVTALPLWFRTIAVMGITLGLPGYWLTRALLRETPRTLQARLEWVVLSVGGGYVLQVLGMTLLSYMPGGITPFQTYATFYGMIFLLMGISVWFPAQATDTTQNTSLSPISDRYIIVMVVVVLLIAGFFRFTNLGYSEFQGDEARAVLRAAAILQGHEETLFLHRKGPTEIVITAVGYSLTEQLSELSARLPFAIAGVFLPLVIFLLGWRLHSPMAGSIAALFVALDGNFIGYGRIVQYHTVSHLMALLVVLFSIRLLQHPKSPLLPSLVYAALFGGIGVLSHYENAQLLVPLGILLWFLWRRGVPLRTIFTSTVMAGVLGIATVASFYVPFVLNPNFGNIADYLAENLVIGEGTFPYNHLSEIFRTATFYSTTYFMIALLALTTIAFAVRLYRRWGWSGSLLAVGLISGLILSGISPDSTRIGGTNIAIVWGLLIFALVWFVPLSRAEQLLWAWFGVQFIVVAFVVARPALHYIPAHLPWALVAGIGAVELYQGILLSQYTFLRRVVVVLGTMIVFIVGGFAYRHFVYNQTEFIREWNWQPEYAWTLHNQQGNIPVFGFPHQSGWKAVGMLYAMGLLDGTYDTNTRDWIAEWYTREALRCERIHTYFFLETNELPWTLEPVRERLAQEFHQIGTITVNGDPRLEVYQAGAATDAPLWTVETSDYTFSFDTTSTYVGLDLDTPVIDPNPTYDAVIQAEDHLWIEGYDLDRVKAGAGEALRVTLYWRVRERMDEDLTITTEVIGNDGEIEGEVNREPGCYTRPTSGWSQNRLVVDHYDIPLFDDAVEGFYMLGASLYDEQSGEFWDFYDEDGALIGEVLDLGDVQIEE